MEQGGDQVVAGLDRPGSDHRLHVRREPGEGLLDPRQVILDADAEGLAQVVGPVGDLLPLILRQPQQEAEDARGVRFRELGDELDLTACGERVNQLSTDPLKFGLHRLDRAAPESWHE